jgi:signal transduction histidine kinase
MKFDVMGRINNMRLPDGKTALLYSVYEAVSNSIHAINDRWGEDKAAEKGKIEVDISLDENGDIPSISISDNGIGFNDENIESFETSDSRFKYKRGGKESVDLFGLNCSQRSELIASSGAVRIRSVLGLDLLLKNRIQSPTSALRLQSESRCVQQ